RGCFFQLEVGGVELEKNVGRAYHIARANIDLIDVSVEWGREVSHFVAAQNEIAFHAIGENREAQDNHCHRASNRAHLRPGMFGTENRAQFFTSRRGPARAKPSVIALKLRQTA